MRRVVLNAVAGRLRSGKLDLGAALGTFVETPGPASCATSRKPGPIDCPHALGRVATALVARLSDELDEVLADYAAFKRAAAVLDFDDLLERARALVRGHDAVRRVLGQRYRHIFVDEFQDTDPIQAEILFRIAADDSPLRWQDSSLRAGALFRPMKLKAPSVAQSVAIEVA